VCIAVFGMYWLFFVVTWFYFSLLINHVCSFNIKYQVDNTVVKGISVSVVAMLNWTLSFLMFYYGYMIRQVLARQWIVQSSHFYNNNNSSSTSNTNSTSTANSATPSTPLTAQSQYSSYSAQPTSRVIVDNTGKHEITSFNQVESNHNSDDDDYDEDRHLRTSEQHDDDENNNTLTNQNNNSSNNRLYASQRDKTIVLRWMLLVGLLLSLTATIHFVFSIVFLLVPLIRADFRVVLWTLVELIPCYIIILFIMRRKSYEQTMTVLFIVQCGTFVAQN